MPLRGEAALMMWCDMAPGPAAEQGRWHSREHLPERLAVPGFLRGRRAAAGGDASIRLFMLYELRDLAVMTSPAYLARLDAPTPWTRRVNAAVSGFNRSPGRVLASVGSGVGGMLATIRLDAGLGMEALGRELVRRQEANAAVVGAHFLASDRSAIVSTAEQRQRGGPDAVADHVFVFEGFERDALRAACASTLAGLPGIEAEVEVFDLAHVLAREELACT